MKKKFLILVFSLVAIVSSALAETKVKEDPILVTTTLSGKNFDLKEHFGKVVIVNFWAAWCAECDVENNILDELYKEHKSQGLEVIGVSIDRERGRKKVAKIAALLSYPNSMFYDAKEISFEDLNSIPRSYVIDRDGNLVVTIINKNTKLTKKDFERILEPFLRN